MRREQTGGLLGTRGRPGSHVWFAVTFPVQGNQTAERNMEWQERIVADPAVLVGKPVIKGTRIAVEFLLQLLAEGWTQQDILRNYPQLVAEDIQAALFHAAELARLERVLPLSA